MGPLQYDCTNPMEAAAAHRARQLADEEYPGPWVDERDELVISLIRGVIRECGMILEYVEAAYYAEMSKEENQRRRSEMMISGAVGAVAAAALVWVWAKRK